MSGRGEGDVCTRVDQQTCSSAASVDLLNRCPCQSLQLTRGQILLTQLDEVVVTPGGQGDSLQQTFTPFLLISRELFPVGDLVKEHRKKRRFVASG